MGWVAKVFLNLRRNKSFTGGPFRFDSVFQELSNSEKG